MRSVRAVVFAVPLLLSLGGCALFGPADTADQPRLTPVTFKDLPGWQADDTVAARDAFGLSCARIGGASDAASPFGGKDFAGTVGDWKDVCAALPPAGSSQAAIRSYFEQRFTPYAVSGNKGRDGLFTGYYEPSLPAAADASGGTPIYARPRDLVTVDLGLFKPELKGQTIAGKVKGEALVPYDTRADIAAGSLKGRADEIGRAADPVDLFFLQVQGSGRLVKPDGRTDHIGYAAQNGHAYYAIGQELVKRGVFTKDSVSMQGIRDWIKANPAEGATLMNKNPSYVFFRPLGPDGVLGAEGVTLTPGRSLAVDRRLYPYGLPVFLDAAHPDAGQPRLQRLMVAQDTGGAIRGVVRGDFFWGPGDDAADRAGRMKSDGRFYILLPATVKLPPAYLKGGMFPW